MQEQGWRSRSPRQTLASASNTPYTYNSYRVCVHSDYDVTTLQRLTCYEVMNNDKDIKKISLHGGDKRASEGVLKTLSFSKTVHLYWWLQWTRIRISTYICYNFSTVVARSSKSYAENHYMPMEVKSLSLKVWSLSLLVQCLLTSLAYQTHQVNSAWPSLHG